MPSGSERASLGSVYQHVVIVDDEVLCVRLFESIVTEIRGVVAHSFTSAGAALEWCHGKDVDCFVLDQRMPPPDGLEMVRILRAMESFALVPIVMVTGENERESRYRAFDAGANDYVQKPVDYRELVARLTTQLQLRRAQKQLGLRIDALEVSLFDSEERSREHAERLESLWRIANNPNLPHDELMGVMLENGAAAIRPGQPFRGLLGRIGGSEVVDLRSGARVPLEQTIVDSTLLGGGTRACDDLHGSDIAERTQAFGWRAAISTRLSAGGTTYALTFASTQPARKSFASQDHAYMEILAEFFAMRMQQQWQASRMREQLERDSLTGLWNRSRLRSLGRAVFHGPAAVAVIDVLRFHEINETRGHLTGDAVLVEVAAGLSAQATGDEIVARVGGDSFAVFFPDVPSHDWLMEHDTPEPSAGQQR